jgi:DNA anti-recombination protein RmuC
MVSLGIRGLAMEERSRELQEGLRRAALEIAKFRDSYDIVGDHLRNAAKKHTESLAGLVRAADAVDSLGNPTEQTKLPLSGDQESTVRQLPFVARRDDR